MSRLQRTKHPRDASIHLIVGRRNLSDTRIEAEIKLSNGDTKVVSTKVTVMVAAEYVAENIKAKLEQQIAETGTAKLRKGRTPKASHVTTRHPKSAGRAELYKPVPGTFGHAAITYRTAVQGKMAAECRRLRDAGEPLHVIYIKSTKHRIRLRALDTKLMPVLKDLRLLEITPAILRKVLERFPTATKKHSFGSMRAVYKQVMTQLAQDSDRDARWPEFVISAEKYKGVSKRGTFLEHEIRMIIDYMTEEWIEGARFKVTRQTRRLLRAYVHIAAISGIRPGLEVDRIRYGDISRAVEDGTEMLLVHVPEGQGKTKEARDSVVNEYDRVCSFETALADLRKVHGNLTEHTRIFVLPNGVQRRFSKEIGDLIRELKLGVSRDGLRRTAYCLRHYFANTMVGNGTDLYPLSQSMGNSPDIMKQHYLLTINRRALAGMVSASKSNAAKKRLVAELARNPTVPDERMTDEEANADPDISDELAHGVRLPWQEPGYLERMGEGFLVAARLVWRDRSITPEALDKKMATMTAEDVAELMR